MVKTRTILGLAAVGIGGLFIWGWLNKSTGTDVGNYAGFGANPILSSGASPNGYPTGLEQVLGKDIFANSGLGRLLSVSGKTAAQAAQQTSNANANASNYYPVLTNQGVEYKPTAQKNNTGIFVNNAPNTSGLVINPAVNPALFSLNLQTSQVQAQAARTASVSTPAQRQSAAIAAGAGGIQGIAANVNPYRAGSAAAVTWNVKHGA